MKSEEVPVSDDLQGIPTAADVIAHLNERFEKRGLAIRVTGIAVLPYVNPMWMSNWEAPELAGLENDEIIAEELREARWEFPQILD